MRTVKRKKDKSYSCVCCVHLYAPCDLQLCHSSECCVRNVTRFLAFLSFWCLLKSYVLCFIPVLVL